MSNRGGLIKGLLVGITIVVLGLWSHQRAVPENRRVGVFDENVVGLPEAKKTETVRLKDGQTYRLVASYVTKKLGDKRVRMLAYNGMVPGPFFVVEKGTSVKIDLVNKTDIETSIHSHGLRLDNQFDGVVGTTQKSVLPGGEFRYKLKFPDSGVFWYHPHVREDYEQEMGLAGGYEVEELGQYEAVNREEGLIIDDILFENEKLAGFYKEKTNFAIMGRFGNVMLVNGETDYSLDLKKGEVVRFFIINAANARPFDLSIPGLKMKLVGGQLSPREKDEWVDHLIIAPAERYVIEVAFPESGEYKLINTSHDLSLGTKTYQMGVFKVSGEKIAEDLRGDFEVLKKRDLGVNELVKRYLYQEPDKWLQLELATGKVNLGSAMDKMPCHQMPDGNWMGKCNEESKKKWLAGLAITGLKLEPIHWEDHIYAVNRKATNEDIVWQLVDRKTGKINHEIDDWKFKKGQLVKVRIFNDPNSAHPMQHPIHFHGQRFLVLSTNGEENLNKSWLDTTMVKVGDTVDLLVEMSNPGVWMAQCHISEHVQSGMMFNFVVE